MKPKWTKQGTIRQSKRPHTNAAQGNLEGGNESREQKKESEIHLFPLLGVPQKHKLTTTTYMQGPVADSCRHHVFCCYFL